MNPLFILLIFGGVALMTMTAKKSGRDIVKEHEGLSLMPYFDTAGKLTIGWGHKILPGENYNDGITVKQAENILTQDMQYAENTVNYYVTAPITQQMYDALVSFVFNIGAQAFANSTLLKKLNTGDYVGASQEFARWKYITVDGQKVVSSGLVNRRAKESALFQEGMTA